MGALDLDEMILDVTIQHSFALHVRSGISYPNWPLLFSMAKLRQYYEGTKAKEWDAHYGVPTFYGDTLRKRKVSIMSQTGGICPRCGGALNPASPICPLCGSRLEPLPYNISRGKIQQHTREHPKSIKLTPITILIGIVVLTLVAIAPVAIFIVFDKSKTVIVYASPQVPTPLPTMGATVISTPTPSPAPSPTPTLTPTAATNTYTPGTIICQPSWANGLQGWSASSDWFVQDGQLLNNGHGSRAGSPTLIPPCQSRLAGVRDYALVVTMQLLQPCCNDNSFFGLETRGTADNNGWHGYNAEIGDGGYTSDGITIRGTATSAYSGFFIDAGKNTYSIEVKGYHLTYKVNDAPKISLDDLTYTSGTDIGIFCSVFQLRIFDLKIVAL